LTKSKKRLIFISTGRCGTKRIAEILDEHLPDEEFAVQHQMDVSRLANVLGNLMYYFGSWEWLKKKLYYHIENKYATGKHFMCSDPLISMILPNKIIKDPNTYIVHIVRKKEAFAHSFFRFTRKRFLSFFAHNFIPFWQIVVWPLENLVNPHIKKKYQRVWQKKNDWLNIKYGKSANYEKLPLEEVFSGEKLNSIVYKVFNYKTKITKDELKVRTNQTVTNK
jgi:hypothetical protein